MKTISVRVDDQIKAALDKIANAQDLKVSQILRKLILEYLKNNPVEEE